MTNATAFETFGLGDSIPRSVLGHQPYQNSGARKMDTNITPTMSGAEALSLSGLNWRIDSVSLEEVGMVNDGADKVFISTRSDNGAIVGVNGARHRPIHNKVLAELGDTIRDVAPEAQFIQGGQRNGGKTTFLMLDLGESRRLDLGGGDLVARNILLGTHHDGGRLFAAGVNARFWCSNQWTGFTKATNRLISISHTDSAERNIQFAHRALETAIEELDVWDRALIELRDTRLSDEGVRAMMRAAAGQQPTDEGRSLTEWENRYDRLWKEYREDHNANLVGTALGVLMAAQGSDEHLGRVSKKVGRTEQRVGRLIDGNYPQAARAMQFAMAA